LGRLDQKIRLALTKVVARPQSPARYLSPDNRGDEAVSLSDAVTSGRAFFVKVAEEILALDADRPEGLSTLAVFDGRLKEVGLSPVVVASGRPGHGHLFVRFRDCLDQRRWREEARLAGFDIRSDIRPPLSPHRIASFKPRLIAPRSVHEVLDALAPNSSRPRPLSSRTADFLLSGDSLGEYRSRSELVMAIINGAVSTGWFPAVIFSALMDLQHIGGRKVQEIARRKGVPTARRYVESACRKAFGYLQRCKFGVTETIRSLMHLSHTNGDWHGRAGNTDRAVLRAHFQIALRVKRLEYGASVREVAELARISSIATVSASHRRLVECGWLKRASRQPRHAKLVCGKVDQQATRWTLREGRDTSITQPNNLSSSWGCKECSVGLTNSSSDVFRWGALGKAAERIFQALEGQVDGRTAQQIAVLQGMSRAAALKQLRKLEKRGLASRSSGREPSWVLGKRSVDEAAQELGTAGALERQMAHHAHERERYLRKRHRVVLIQ
jgi:hypothetical protein